jgi:hypothetical protein
MILRRVIEHVKAQNWTAVALDFVIVVVGVVIGIQVANWNEDRKSRVEEQAILLQLEEEFAAIRDGVERQINIRERWAEHLYVLVETLEGIGSSASDDEIKLGLDAATGAGRQLPQSVTFLQLMSSGELSKLSDEKLRFALMQYDARLRRDAFIHEKLIEFVFNEVSHNDFVDRNMLLETRAGAAIDQDLDGYTARALASIRSYDLDGLKQYETHYEAIYRSHLLQLTAEEAQLDLVREILRLISAEITR